MLFIARRTRLNYPSAFFAPSRQEQETGVHVAWLRPCLFYRSIGVTTPVHHKAGCMRLLRFCQPEQAAKKQSNVKVICRNERLLSACERNQGTKNPAVAVHIVPLNSSITPQKLLVACSLPTVCPKGKDRKNKGSAEGFVLHKQLRCL